MNIRPYTAADKDACLAIFKSNCPAFFDEQELEPFIHWLDCQAQGKCTYPDSKKDYYYVLETPDKGIAGCGGFYIVAGSNTAQLAWGMIEVAHHKKGYGTALYKYRYEKIKSLDPDLSITLGTSQHTYAFFEKMGLKVTRKIVSGYGKDLDRYDMMQ